MSPLWLGCDELRAHRLKKNTANKQTKINALGHSHCQILSLVCRLKYHVHCFYPIDPKARAKMPGIVNKDYSNKTENNSICCSQRVGDLYPGGVVFLSWREGTVKGSEIIGSTLWRLPYQELANLKKHIIKIKIRIISWEDPTRYDVDHVFISFTVL